MSDKRDDLESLSKPALKEILNWLFAQNRLADDPSARAKDECVEVLMRKLDADQVSDLVRRCADKAPFFNTEQLTRVLGALPKDQMLEAVSKEDLQDAMEKLDDGGKVQIAWRSLSKERLQDYLRAKCSQAELGELLGFAKRAKPQPKASDGRDDDRSTAKAPVATKGDRKIARVETREEFLGYRLMRRLTGGGMAEAYEALDPASGKNVFLKRVREAGQHASPMKREAAIYEKLSRRRFEHVMEVLDYKTEDGWIVLVTEFADGGDLDTYVSEQGGSCLAPSLVKRIGRELVGAVAELHDQEIVHRDLKPQNILRSKTKWKVADFGIAKNLDRLMTAQTFQKAGTRGYMAPEQEDGVPAHRSQDVYSLGKILVFMLTGQTDPDHVEFPSWIDVVRRCIARNPEKRPSARELESLLSQVPA